MPTHLVHPIKSELNSLRKQYPNKDIFITVKGGLFDTIKSLFTKSDNKRELLYVAPSRSDNRVLPYSEDFYTIIAKDLQSQQSEVVQVNRITQIRVGELTVTINF